MNREEKYESICRLSKKVSMLGGIYQKVGLINKEQVIQDKELVDELSKEFSDVINLITNELDIINNLDDNSFLGKLFKFSNELIEFANSQAEYGDPDGAWSFIKDAETVREFAIHPSLDNLDKIFLIVRNNINVLPELLNNLPNNEVMCSCYIQTLDGFSEDLYGSIGNMLYTMVKRLIVEKGIMIFNISISKKVNWLYYSIFKKLIKEFPYIEIRLIKLTGDMHSRFEKEQLLQYIELERLSKEIMDISLSATYGDVEELIKCRAQTMVAMNKYILMLGEFGFQDTAIYELSETLNDRVIFGIAPNGVQKVR